jgi:hypothetical protein
MSATNRWVGGGILPRRGKETFMRRATPILGTALLLLWTAGAFAQGKPNFAGNWVQDKDKTTAANASAAPGQQPAWSKVTIRQDDKNFTVELTDNNGKPAPRAYVTDGAQHKIPMGTNEATYTAKWDGNTVVVEQTSPGRNGAPQMTKYVFAMDGNQLVVTTTQGTATRKGIYNKS